MVTRSNSTALIHLDTRCWSQLNYLQVMLEVRKQNKKMEYYTLSRQQLSSEFLAPLVQPELDSYDINAELIKRYILVVVEVRTSQNSRY